MQLNQLAAYLENKAKSQQTVFYSEVVSHFGLPSLDGAWNNHPLSKAFHVLDQQDANAKRPFRTSVVIGKESNIPGPGYFTSLASLKSVFTNNESQRLTAFTSELKAALAYPW